MKAPSSIVIKSPSHELANIELNITPNNALNSIIPSNAIFIIPDLAAMVAANVANRIGVVILNIEEKNSGDKITSNILLRLLYI